MVGRCKEFGFECGHFDIVMTAEKLLVPGSRGTLKKSLLPRLSLDETSGQYRMELRDGAGTAFMETVNLMWVGHPKEPEPFLAFRCSDPEVVRDALQALKGKHISMRFEIPAGHH